MKYGRSKKRKKQNKKKTKKQLGLLQLHVISECYFLQFSKIIKFQQMLLTRIRNSVQNAYSVTHGLCEIYEIFIFEFTYLWYTHILFTVLKCSESTVLHNSVSRE